MAKDSLWFYRGREARGRGEPRDLRDGRISPENRADWNAGWDEEERLRAPAPSDEQIDKHNAGLRALRAALLSKP